MNDFWELINRYQIAIPIIQRDYAHGRDSKKVIKVRGMLLDAIFAALEDGAQPLELDFIYGYVQKSQSGHNEPIETFYPLDGQQRLTTLFLIHWYVAAREGKLDEVSKILKKFSYETRHQTKVFCDALCAARPVDFDIAIRQMISNCPWFLISWQNDPTISSMLVMLDAIQQKVEASPQHNLWEKLTRENPPIMFQLLHMNELNLPDELYIKMNSRGKELTEFEYFKARFSEILDAESAEYFNHRIDRDWQDLFWNLYESEHVDGIATLVDAGFIRFIEYITYIIAIESEDNAEDMDAFEFYRLVYSNPKNLEFLFNVLDSLCRQHTDDPDFFNETFYATSSDWQENKTRLFFVNPNANLLKKCADAYDPTQRNNPFSIGEQLLLYGCIIHLIHQSESFPLRIRMLRNLISNSEDTVRSQYMSTHIKDVIGIILHGEIQTESEFSKNQIQEEKGKLIYLQQNPKLAETVYRLEDHELLQGCVALFGLDEDIEKYATKFLELFSPGCNFILISMALFTFGDYTQRMRWRSILGNRYATTWRQLFTPSQSRSGFEQTTKILYSMMDHLILDPRSNPEGIVEKYLKNHLQSGIQKDWKYYFIKYKTFRYHSEGFYYWPEIKRQYECLMMSKTNLNGYNWDPFLYTISQICTDVPLSIENFGNPLLLTTSYGDIEIKSVGNGFLFSSLDAAAQPWLDKARIDKILNMDFILEVRQNKDGIDIEDRIEVVAKTIERFYHDMQENRTTV
jgi:hypothetical protein